MGFSNMSFISNAELEQKVDSLTQRIENLEKQLNGWESAEKEPPLCNDRSFDIKTYTKVAKLSAYILDLAADGVVAFMEKGGSKKEKESYTNAKQKSDTVTDAGNIVSGIAEIAGKLVERVVNSIQNSKK